MLKYESIPDTISETDGDGMKVLQINSTCGYGSTGRIAVDILRKVEETGGQGMIAYGRMDAPEGVPAYRIGSQWGVRWHGVLSRLTDRHGMYSAAATRRLVKQIQDYEPDIIHLHNVHGYYLHLPTLFGFLKKYGKPVVWTLHDCWSFTGHCAHFSYEGCSRWKTGCYNCPLKKEYPQSLLLDGSSKNWNQKKDLFGGLSNVTLVTPSQWLRELVKDSYLGHFPVRVIPNGIDLTVFRPTTGDFREKYGLSGKQIILGVASVWTEKKGFVDFLRLQKRLSPDQKLVLVGLNDTQLANLSKEIIGIKRTQSAAELAALYSAADVFLNLTYEDTYPTTNLEAIACGTPVITYRTGGSPESVSAGNGFVVEQGDLDAVVQAMKKANGVKDDVLKQFDAALRYGEYVDLYKELLCHG